MPIYKKKGMSILHIHIPKVGGSSVIALFASNKWQRSFIDYVEGNPCNYQHYHYSLLEKEHDLKNDFNYIFTIVRNPYTRAISEYRWQNKNKELHFNDWFKKNTEAYHENPFIEDNHFRPQYHFIGRNVNRIFRHEQSRISIFTEIEDMLEINLTHKNMHINKKKFDVKISDIDFDAIYDFYRLDFDTFGYEKNSYPT